MKIRLAARAIRETFRDGLLQQVRLAVVSQLKSPAARCPICGFKGKFRGFGVPVRTSAQCPDCWSLERHRLFALAVQRGAISFDGKTVLNFTPDGSVSALARNAAQYHTSNYPTANGADFDFDIQDIEAPDNSYDIVICSHVLEHVDDRRALRELHRILRTGGQLLFMIPIVEGWSSTYENDEVQSEEDRHIHFGQFDHVRYYGADIRDRVRSAGFTISEVTAEASDCIEYALQRGEKVFIASKA